jgi:hypothetical protein
MPAIRRHSADDVQSDGEFQASRIEIRQMICLPGRCIQQFLGQIPNAAASDQLAPR